MDSEQQFNATSTNDKIKLIEAESSAKEVASKKIGRTAIPWIVLLVIVGVAASAFLPSESLPAVIGLVSTAVMALIGMLTGITGTKDKEEKPEFKVINELIQRLDQKEPPMRVDVENGKVTVSKGHDVVTMKEGQ
jgi:hypothetical protein